MLSIAVFFATGADALVLGDIQVNSHLGQSLNAQIAFVDISDVDVQQLKIRLASAEEYRKLDLQYPENMKFVFKVVNEPGALVPFIRIFTSRPLDEPFVNLLIEITQSSGKLTKAYTFLLDPAAELISSDEPAVRQIPQAAETVSGVRLEKPVKSIAAREKPVESASKQRSRHQGVKTVKTARTVQAEGQTQDDRKSHMKLSMSLSISKYDPSLPVSSKETSDVLQEELIAKEKSLEDLKLQIGEMQGVIKSLQNKLGPSDLAGSTVAVVSEIKPADESVKPVAPLPAALTPPAKTSVTEDWLNPLLAIVVLLLGGAVFVWYRKYRQMHAWQHGSFEDAGDEPVEEQMPCKLVEPAELIEPIEPVKQVGLIRPAVKTVEPVEPVKRVEPSVATAPVLRSAPVIPAVEPVQAVVEKPSLSFGERSMETPAYAEPLSTPTVPPEYAILMEANKHMRSGKEKLAEEALIRAIEVNPRNPYGYQALLKIYGTRNDAAGFENIARKLRESGYVAAFEEAAETGRKLYPDNPLYV
jgi:hypothetical protein